MIPLQSNSLYCKKRSQDLDLHLPEISQDSLRKKTQRAEKLYILFEEIGLDKIKHIKSYSAYSISKLINNQIQEIIEHSSQEISSENHMAEISETIGPTKILPENAIPLRNHV